MGKSNLIDIPVLKNCNTETSHNKLKLNLVNTQSIKNKDHLITNLLDEQNIDIFAVTETWLTNRDSNTVWLISTICNTTNLKMQVSNRQDRHGEGIGLIYRSHYNP